MHNLWAPMARVTQNPTIQNRGKVKKNVGLNKILYRWTPKMLEIQKPKCTGTCDLESLSFIN